MEITGVIFTVTEIVGTVAFAVSGALIAIDRQLDLFGVLFLGVVTALGGGTIRDILLGVFPPRAFYSYEYLAVAFLTALAVLSLSGVSGRAMHVSGRHLRALIIFLMRLVLQLFRLWVHRLPWAQGYGENAFLCVFLGMTTGIGGGILRDVLSKEVPFVFKKHVYGVASLGWLRSVLGNFCTFRLMIRRLALTGVF